LFIGSVDFDPAGMNLAGPITQPEQSFGQPRLSSFGKQSNMAIDVVSLVA
jgi:hypothetical protein